MVTPRHPLLYVLGLLGVVGLISSCADDADIAQSGAEIAIYRTVIEDLAAHWEGEPADSEALPVVFVQALGSDAIAIETQVGIVTEFGETYEIRFIDGIEEALELELDGQPVKPNSMLIALSPVRYDSETNDIADVRGELYIDAGDIRAYRYSFASENDTWTMVHDPEVAEPEGFPASP